MSTTPLVASPPFSSMSVGRASMSGKSGGNGGSGDLNAESAISTPAGAGMIVGGPLVMQATLSSSGLSSLIRAVSPPTPAPSPQPESRLGAEWISPALSSMSNGHGDAHGHGQFAAQPSTPVSPPPGDTTAADELNFDIPAADLNTQFIDSVVGHFPRLSGPERRRLFSSLLPVLLGEDLLHLSQLISPFLRRDFLSELPAEISLHILAFIDDPKDLVRASRVSRTWRSLVSDEHTWKVMLQRYRGRGWWSSGEASATRPPIERIRLSHPEARFGAITSPPPASAGTIQRRSFAAQQQQQPFFAPALPPSQPVFGRPSTNATQQRRNSTSSSTYVDAAGSSNGRRMSALSPMAQPFQSRRPSLSIQNALAGYAGPVASTSAGTNTGAALQSTAEETAAEVEEGIDQFQQENQTPLAERRRRTKGKGRPPRLEDESVVPPASLVPTSGTVAHPASATAAGFALQGLGFSARRQSHQVARSPNAPLIQPLSAVSRNLPAPQDLTAHFGSLSLAPPASSAASLAIDSSIASPTARFSSISYASPVVPAFSPSGLYAVSSSQAQASPSPLSRRIISPVPVPARQLPREGMQHPVAPLPQPLAAPQPVRYVTRRSQNPFGTALTSIPAATAGTAGPPAGQQYDAGDRYAQTAQHASVTSPFSYKAQFKRAYLTESNWLKGPGRLLSRQTSADDGVVTSLGFDNDWIVVGMATNQIHVFDARTGEYVRELEGHTLGVWCLVLVSKGGERLDKDGKPTNRPVDAETPQRTCWDSEEEEEDTDAVAHAHDASTDRETSGSASSEDDEAEAHAATTPQYAKYEAQRSDGMPRCRSASARPPDVERFFQEASPFPGGIATGTAQSCLSPNSAVLGDTAPSFHRAASSPVVSPACASGGGSASKPGRSGLSGGRPRTQRRPSSFSGIPSTEQQRQSSSSGFVFGDSSRISQQQAAACGTASGWGQRGAIAVTGGCDRDVRVWEVETGKCLHVLRGHVSTVRCLKVLDGRPIAVSGSRDATLRVWDIEQGVQLRLLAGHQHSVRCIEISGNKVVSGSYDTTCRIWDVDTGECLHVLNGHQHQIYAVAFDGIRVASGSLDSTVRIWSAKTGECLALLQGHTSLVGQLQLTDSVLVTGGSDGRVIVFSLSTFECLHRLCAHDNSVTCLQFNDRFMVTGGNDGKVKLWDRPTGKLIRELAEPCEAVWRVTFREDKCVLLCKRNGRTIMDVRTFAPFEDEL